MKRGRLSKLFGALFALVVTLGLVGQANAALLGVNASTGLPDITSNGTGTLDYDVGTTLFSITQTPLSITFDGVNPLTIFDNFDLTNNPKRTATTSFQFFVDSTGALTGGVALDDLVISGNIDSNTDGTTDFTGILLTAEITGFGFLDLGASLPDLFDALLTVTGGTLTGIGGGFAVGQTIGATIFAEQSLFTGVFTQSFNATKVKSDVAPTPTPEPGTLLLLGFGAASLGLGLRKRRK